MTPYTSILLEIGLPVLLMLARASGSPSTAFCAPPARSPGCAATAGCIPTPSAAPAIPWGWSRWLLLHLGYPRACFLFFTFWMITDITDGDIARKCDLHTEEGETIDPLSDKLMYLPMLVYLAWRGWLDPAAARRSFWPSTSSARLSRQLHQGQGGEPLRQGQDLPGGGAADRRRPGVDLRPSPSARPHHPAALGMCAFLAFCSTAFKLIPNYWYANILSLMNLVCGLAGCWVILTGRPPVYALGLVFLGQFLDLFDGRAAERWGSTPKGEVFDDVADGTSFGLTVGTDRRHLLRPPVGGRGDRRALPGGGALSAGPLRGREAQGGNRWRCGHLLRDAFPRRRPAGGNHLPAHSRRRAPRGDRGRYRGC